MNLLDWFKKLFDKRRYFLVSYIGFPGRKTGQDSFNFTHGTVEIIGYPHINQAFLQSYLAEKCGLQEIMILHIHEFKNARESRYFWHAKEVKQ